MFIVPTGLPNHHVPANDNWTQLLTCETADSRPPDNNRRAKVVIFTHLTSTFHEVFTTWHLIITPSPCLTRAYK